MVETSERKELERRLDQAQRMSKQTLDSLVQERLARLIRDLEGRLR